MYYVLKVGDKYLGFSIGEGPTLSDRQRDAVRFDAPSFKPIEGWLNLRFVKVVPRLSPADVLPDDAAIQADVPMYTAREALALMNVGHVHEDIDATTRASDTLSSWENVPLGAPSACRNR